ncbi:MAG: leucine-rich repeat domain-containing protein [Candidatus Kariarchaeaceae archaeon]
MPTEMAEYQGYELPATEVQAILDLNERIKGTIKVKKKPLGSFGKGIFIENNHVTELGLDDFRFKKIRELPSTMDNLSKLKKMFIKSWDLKKLPDSICNLPELEVLELSFSKLTELPENIGNLRALKHLGLIFNPLTRLPRSVNNLKNIISINLEAPKSSSARINLDDKLMVFDLIERNIRQQNQGREEEINNQLSHLNLEETDLSVLKSLPVLDFDGIAERLEIENRRIISMSFFDSIERSLLSLPEEIGNLSELETLLVHKNNLRVIPQSIGDLSKLRSLDVSDNHLSEIPSSIVNLKSIGTLNFNQNHIKYLPENIGRLKNLSVLGISNNNIQNIPESISELTKLMILEISNNPLESIPKSIAKLPKLKTIWISQYDEKLFSKRVKTQLRDQGCQMLFYTRSWVGGPGGDREDVVMDALTDNIVEVL